jgi:hypothetical protein
MRFQRFAHILGSLAGALMILALGNYLQAPRHT